ncbi:DUF6479 family protein [Streptomyces sp. H27-C3]|uniref:DUF6479 family protein n=1 Tax=Streptomyces sp. H27-C3 TaxID=3046305 RepID=UPI0024BA6C5A|nr:DUF6479 family protein [Streptomyces sp. H27-C3]MDJ0460212.1 DUF6479 family protein [Streptomyces sp. H27-C3]
MSTLSSEPVVHLAAGAFPAVLWALVGIVVVALLLGAFWWGSRRTAERPMPPQEPQPRSDSWQTPDESLHGDDGPQDPGNEGRR